MKIIFDIDGTLTDYNAFVQKTAVPWFQKHYGWQAVNLDAIEIEDVFDLRGHCTREQCEKIMDRFWISHRFLKYVLFTRFRPYAGRTVRKFQKKGYQVEIFTSRKKTADKNPVGSIARLLTYIQLAVNGVFLPMKAIHFFKDDQEKVKAIIRMRPQIMLDDKPIIAEQLDAAKIKTACVTGFEPEIFHQELCKVYGVRPVQMMDDLAQSGKFYKTIMRHRKLLFRCGRTKVQILNEQNLVKDYEGGVLYVSNHRSTLDPLYITGYINREIHWVALKRFFTAEDSIFNNSKNPLLCRITQYCFNRLYFFPIERKKDNPDADNFQTAKAMNTCLKVGGNVGIFPEGTTTRREEDDFNTFDPGFIGLAEQTKAIIQPITVFWEKKDKKHKRVIINFGQPFTMENRKRNEAFQYFEEIQRKALKENKDYADKVPIL